MAVAEMPVAPKELRHDRPPLRTPAGFVNALECIQHEIALYRKRQVKLPALLHQRTRLALRHHLLHCTQLASQALLQARLGTLRVHQVTQVSRQKRSQPRHVTHVIILQITSNHESRYTREVATVEKRNAADITSSVWYWRLSAFWTYLRYPLVRKLIVKQFLRRDHDGLPSLPPKPHASIS